MEEDFLVFLIEFIVSGSISHLFRWDSCCSIFSFLCTVCLSALFILANVLSVLWFTTFDYPYSIFKFYSTFISHLFTYEEQTTIINSIRTEVTLAGLTYTRDTAWNFFLGIVRNNFRICMIHCDGGQLFQRRCMEYPAFTENVNFLWFPHWSIRTFPSCTSIKWKNFDYWGDNFVWESHIQATKSINSLFFHFSVSVQKQNLSYVKQEYLNLHFDMKITTTYL
jgi:hypothetical protein